MKCAKTNTIIVAGAVMCTVNDKKMKDANTTKHNTTYIK